MLFPMIDQRSLYCIVLVRRKIFAQTLVNPIVDKNLEKCLEYCSTIKTRCSLMSYIIFVNHKLSVVKLFFDLSALYRPTGGKIKLCVLFGTP